MFAHRLIEDDSLRSTPEGASLQIRLNWYRSLPLSSVAILEVSLDDEPVDPSRVTLEVDERHYGLDALRESTDRWWYVLDAATVHLGLDAPLAPGEHRVTVRLGSRAPYIIIGPTIDDVYTVTDSCTKVLAAA